MRTGYINTSDFNKALKEVFEELLTDGQVEQIQNRYCVHNNPDCFNWSKFLHDTETGKIIYYILCVDISVIKP